MMKGPTKGKRMERARRERVKRRKISLSKFVCRFNTHRLVANIQAINSYAKVCPDFRLNSAPPKTALLVFDYVNTWNFSP